MTKLSETQRYAVSRLDTEAGVPRSAYQLQVSLATLRSLCRLGYAQDVTRPGPGGMFSPQNHYRFVWAQGERPSKIAR